MKGGVIGKESWKSPEKGKSAATVGKVAALFPLKGKKIKMAKK